MSEDGSDYSDELQFPVVELGEAVGDEDGGAVFDRTSIPLTAKCWQDWDGGKLGGQPVSKQSTDLYRCPLASLHFCKS
jgi:hypothetical protein